jgi:DeoR/GlpR family transcriptional regulator of sugar metabolism
VSKDWRDASTSDSTQAGVGSRRAVRQRAISEAVMKEGAVRIEQIAERFDISLMTVHRDLDELESRGLLRKSRGMATALSSSLVESSDVFRAGQQQQSKIEVAHAALELIEPGQAVFLDDSTTVQQLGRLLSIKAPLTVITNFLMTINELNTMRGISLVALGGTYHNWCRSFMGQMTTTAIEQLRADVFVMSTAAITDDRCFHQSQETVSTKRAMFDVSACRILLADHTKFDKRALYGLANLTEFDQVIVDARTREVDVDRLRGKGVRVMVAPALEQVTRKKP